MDRRLQEIIIKYSVGIGRTFNEAAAALMEAKQTGDRNSLENIVVHDGDPISDVAAIETNAERYLMVLNHLIASAADSSVLKACEGLSLDPKTGLFNTLGYEAARQELRDRGVEDGWYILFDGNDMHGHNEKKGYSVVDLYLEATGRAIAESVRSGNERRAAGRSDEGSEDRRRAVVEGDALPYRVNDSAGDEFLVYVAGNTVDKPETAVDIARRILDRVYELECLVAAEQESGFEETYA
jgi:GGDEF domain-containing protein